MSFESENDRLKNENQEQQLKLEKQTKTIQRLTERSKTLQKALRQFKKESSTKEKKITSVVKHKCHRNG
jgi:predicted  nucleic acid-binding Zn-ribbon protein